MVAEVVHRVEQGGPVQVQLDRPPHLVHGALSAQLVDTSVRNIFYQIGRRRHEAQTDRQSWRAKSLTMVATWFPGLIAATCSPAGHYLAAWRRSKTIWHAIPVTAYGGAVAGLVGFACPCTICIG